MMVQIPELYGCIETPTWLQEHVVLVSVLGAAGFVGLVLLVLWAYNRYRASRKPCWIIALERVGALSLGSGASQPDTKRFYAGLTDVLRWYCYKRFGWPLLDKTESEVLGILQETGVDAAVLDHLEKCLITSVQVKFARGSVAVEQAEADRQVIISFIEQTIPARSGQ